MYYFIGRICIVLWRLIFWCSWSGCFGLASGNVNAGADIGQSKKQVKVGISFLSLSRRSCIPGFYTLSWRIVQRVY